ncbi:MAG TPA: class II aldolase/adducin family protein [Clostridiaceae bacterium]|jgi:L-ribulose-5-phosphate 4-epimerase|nr:class II aldolase/adducin family protein [Clostridiaceae bacterium]
MVDISKIKDEMLIAAERAYTRGIQTGNGGNFSARIPNEDLMLVKASGGSFIDASHENLLITDFNGVLVEGKGKPTREALLHGLIYKIAPHVNGIMHCHSPWSIGWASTRRNLENVTHHLQLKFGCPIVTLDIDAAVVSADHFPKIEAIFEKYPTLPAFLLVDHGVVAVGKNIIDAEYNAELIEETAQVAFLKEIAASFCQTKNSGL